VAPRYEPQRQGAGVAWLPALPGGVRWRRGAPTRRWEAPAQAAPDPPLGPRPPTATLAKTTKASFLGAPGCTFVWENVAFLKFTYK
jgi:hypothetical protein